MDNDRATGQSSGKITSGIARVDTLALSTISFVYEQLPSWRDDPDRPDEIAEDKLNLQLCKYLDTRARFDFPMVRFDREEPQTCRRRVDLAASPAKTTKIGARTHTIYDPFLVLEGKRLPAPSSAREREYVTGLEERTGGIQRFKLGLHGANMVLATMIAFIQEKSPSDWYGEVNKWIVELGDSSMKDVCIWSADETLSSTDENQSKGVARYLSAHSREKLDKITIHHLWVRMKRSA